MDLYKEMKPEIFAEDFDIEPTLAEQILKKVEKGSLRDIFFSSMLLEDLSNIPYKGPMKSMQVLKWTLVTNPSNITPYGMVQPEWTLEHKYGYSYFNGTPKKLMIEYLKGTYKAYGIYDRLERSIYMSNFPALLNISKAMLVYVKTQEGVWGWTIENTELPENLLFAIAYAQKKNYGGIIYNNLFYPTPNAMFDEPTTLLNVNTDNEKQRYAMFLRAKEFYKLAGNFAGKVADYKEEDEQQFAPENTTLLLPKNFLPHITTDKISNLLDFIIELLRYKKQGSFIIYPVKDYWKIRKSKYFQIGDRIITYALVDDQRLKIDVNLGKSFYDYFLTKNYLYNVYQVRGKYYIIR